MASARLFVSILLALLVTASALAVTTVRDLRAALRDLAAVLPAENMQESLPPEFLSRVDHLRHRLRDFGIGSVIFAARQAQSLQEVLPLANRRIASVAFPLSPNADFSGQFSPSADLRLFAVDGAPNWIGARVEVALPCGADVSLYFFRLDPLSSPENGFEPKFLLAKENPLSSLGDAASSLQFTARTSDDQMTLELATIESSAWCRSNWRTASVNVIRSAEHAYRPERLFRHQEIAFINGHPQPTVALTQDGYRFRFRTHYWLDSQQHSRQVDLRLRVAGSLVQMLIPEADDPAIFLDQWVATPWSASRAWTTGENLSSLQSWHQSLAPAADVPVNTEVVGVGACDQDRLVWVRIQRLGQSASPAEVYGLLRRQQDGYRVDRFAEQLPPSCQAQRNE